MTTTIHRHWRDVPESSWRWPNFSAAEIACRGTGAIRINTEAMDKLQALSMFVETVRCGGYSAAARKLGVAT